MAVINQPDSTSLSLLRRVRQLDGDAWERLCALYGPIVYGWCRGRGLQDSDAADAVQDVFRSVYRGIGDFHGGQEGNIGTFRGWLWSITRNQVRLHFRLQGQRPQALGGSDAQQRFSQQPGGLDARDDPELDDGMVRRRILHNAVGLIQGDFQTGTWEAFRRVTLLGQSIDDVAVDLGMTPNAVRQAKFRVLRRLREELDGQL